MLQDRTGHGLLGYGNADTAFHPPGCCLTHCHQPCAWPDSFLSSLSPAGTDPEGCRWRCFGQCLWPLHRPVGQVSRTSLRGQPLSPWVQSSRINGGKRIPAQGLWFHRLLQVRSPCQTWLGTQIRKSLIEALSGQRLKPWQAGEANKGCILAGKWWF